ncbi:PEP-CTERM sorting domain-containing protein [bacterium]|nr:PEP-CTERM sorting domain-containing protein [bacterium]
MNNGILTRKHRSVCGLIIGSVVLVSAIMATPSSAVIVTYQEGVSPTGAYDVEDAELRSGANADLNFDLNPRWNMGAYGGPVVEREVAAFPISLPPESTVLSVTLEVRQEGNPAAYGNGVSLYRITNNDFTNETTVTWNSATTGSAWATAGGDYNPTVLSSVTVGASDPRYTKYTFTSSPAFIAAVDSAVAGDGVLRLLAMATNETPTAYVSFIGSDNHSFALTYNPLLTIEYLEKVPEPTTVGLLGLGAVLAGLGWRRWARGGGSGRSA